MTDHPYASPPNSTCNATDYIYYTSPTITSQPLNNIMLTNINDTIATTLTDNNIYTTFDLTNIQQPIPTTTTSMTSIQSLPLQHPPQQIPINMMTSTPLYDTTQQEVYPILNNNIPINNSHPNSPNQSTTMTSTNHNHPNHNNSNNNHHHSITTMSNHTNNHTNNNNHHISESNVNNKMNQETYILHLEKKLEDAKQLHTEYYFRIEQLMALVEKQSIKIAELQDQLQLNNRQ
ncbi:unnamed protein product [Cunninghamella blakesleeana]